MLHMPVTQLLIGVIMDEFSEFRANDASAPALKQDMSGDVTSCPSVWVHDDDKLCPRTRPAPARVERKSEKCIVEIGRKELQLASSCYIDKLRGIQGVCG